MELMGSSGTLGMLSIMTVSYCDVRRLLSSYRDKVLKLLVELLGSSSKDLVISTLRLTHLLMLKYEWRVSFATEGGVKAILSCMQEFSSVTPVQQLALAVRKPPQTVISCQTETQETCQKTSGV